jgi:hypothetical protein
MPDRALHVKISKRFFSYSKKHEIIKLFHWNVFSSQAREVTGEKGGDQFPTPLRQSQALSSACSIGGRRIEEPQRFFSDV